MRLPGSPWDSPLDRPLPRGRHGYPLDEVVIYQRVRLLDAFVAEVSCHGFPATQVSRVCSRAGTSTKAFYRIFGSKNECLLHAFDAGAVVVCEHGALAFRRAAGPWEARVTAAVRRMLLILADNPPFARMALVELLRLGPVAVERLEAVAAHCLVQLEARWPPTTPGLAPEAHLGAVVAAAVRVLGWYTTAGRTECLGDLAETLGSWLPAWAGGAGAPPPSLVEASVGHRGPHRKATGPGA